MLTLFLFAIGALILFVIGLSITLMVKGHNIEGDVGDNRHMKEKGLRCTIEEMSGRDDCPTGGQECCATCSTSCFR